MREPRRPWVGDRNSATGERLLRERTRAAPAVRRTLLRFCGAACALAVLCAVLAGDRVKAAQNSVPDNPPNPAPVTALRLAVVDLDRVFEQSDEWQDHQEQRSQLTDAMRRTLSKYDRQIRLLRDEYADLLPGTTAAAEKVTAIEAAVREFRAEEEQFEQRVNAQYTKSLSAMFSKIAAVLDAYAEANSIDLVLKKQNLRASSATSAEMGIIMATADVLYVSDRFDVTEAIIKQLNAEWEQGLILSP